MLLDANEMDEVKSKDTYKKYFFEEAAKAIHEAQPEVSLKSTRSKQKPWNSKAKRNTMSVLKTPTNFNAAKELKTEQTCFIFRSFQDDLTVDYAIRMLNIPLREIHESLIFNQM